MGLGAPEFPYLIPYLKLIFTRKLDYSPCKCFVGFEKITETV